MDRRLPNRSEPQAAGFTVSRRRRRLAGCLVVCAMLSSLAGCGRPILSADDAIVAPGEKAKLVAYVEREAPLGLRKDIEDVPVTFFVEDQEVGRAKAGDRGRATVRCRLPVLEASHFTAKATVLGQELETSGRIFSWRDDRVIIAVDIDGTISDTEFKELIFKKKDNDSDPIKASQKTLVQMAADYQIMYFTARPRLVMETTRSWLKKHEYPDGPIVMAPSIRQMMRPSEYKRRTLAAIRDDWPNLLIGIGNRRIDAAAYGANKMLVLIVADPKPEGVGDHAICFRNWKGLGEFLAANRAALTDPEKVKEAVRGELMLLQPVHAWHED